MSRILFVEDDFALAMGTEYALKSEGYEVIHASDIKSARENIENIDLILLDVMLPDGNGYDFCKEIREKGILTPIVFLTAMSEEINIVQGLEYGGDDYIAKPYRVKELMSRIKAMLRRSSYGNNSAVKEYRFGNHIFYADEYLLKCGNKTVECTKSELRLLKEMLIHAGQVLTRKQMLDRIYDIDGDFIDDNTLSVYVKRLRDKLGDDSGFIETVRGVGYRFVKE